MERKHGRARRVWIFDRGIVSEENLQRLRRRGPVTWWARLARNSKATSGSVRAGFFFGAIAATAAPPAINADTALIELAKQKFGELTRAEEKLFDAAAKGEIASELAQNDAENVPTYAASWNAQCVLRADRIQWLCANRQASALVTMRHSD